MKYEVKKGNKDFLLTMLSTAFSILLLGYFLVISEEDGNTSTSQNHETVARLSYFARNNEEEYCARKYYRQTNVGDWTPKPINGILIQIGKVIRTAPKTLRLL